METKQENSMEIKQQQLGLNLEYYKKKCQAEKHALSLEKIAAGLQEDCFQENNIPLNIFY